MQAIRQICTAQTNTLILNIPQAFLGKQLEVIMLPVNAPVDKQDNLPSLLQVLASLEDCEDEFPDVDDSLLPLDDARILA